MDEFRPLFIRQQTGYNLRSANPLYEMLMYDAAQEAPGFCYDEDVDYGTCELMEIGA